jgi:hypothetical protein
MLMELDVLASEAGWATTDVQKIGSQPDFRVTFARMATRLLLSANLGVIGCVDIPCSLHRLHPVNGARRAESLPSSHARRRRGKPGAGQAQSLAYATAPSAGPRPGAPSDAENGSEAFVKGVSIFDGSCLSETTCGNRELVE